MSLPHIRQTILSFLVSETPEILLIRGWWGVGKTHLLNECLQEANSSIKVPVCRLSLFGVSSLHEVKFALATQLLFADKKHLSLFNKAIKRGSKLSGVIEALVPDAQKALGLAAFNALGSAIVCFDDLERKHSSLTMNELLGLATLLRDEKQSKVVFLLNTDMLQEADKADFQCYKEKVIDIDLLLEPTPQESIAIASTQGQSTEHASLNTYIEKLGINNIRIIRRIYRQWDTLKAHLPSPPFRQPTIDSAASALCLFMWVHYGTADNKPNVDFLKDYKVWNAKKDADPKVQTWCALLEAYGYHTTDELDLEIESFVRTGVIRDELAARADILNKQAEKAALEADFTKSWEMYHGSFQDNKQEVLDAIYASFKRAVKAISPGNLNGTVWLFKILGDHPRAQELIDYYIEQNGDEPDLFDIRKSGVYFFQEPEPEVLAAFNKKREAIEASVPNDLVYLMTKLMERDSLHTSEEKRLAHVSVDSFYAYFKSLSTKADDAVRACLRYSGYQDDRKAIAENAIKALQRIAGESELQAQRIALKLGKRGILSGPSQEHPHEEDLEEVE